MTLRHIHIFIAVCDTGSTVKASDALNLAQPSISLAIKELEQYYGIKLFDRISRKLVLTEAGRSFLIYAREINTNFLSLETQFKDYDKTKYLSIGSSITIGIFILPILIKQFKETYPETELNVVVRDSVTISSMVVENKLDIAFIETSNFSDETSKMMTHTPFYKDKLVLVVSLNSSLTKKDKVRLKDLSNHQMILREKDSAGRTLIDRALSKENMEMLPVWESVSNDAILSMVSENLGISILPNGVVNNHLLKEKVKQIEICDVNFERTYSIIHHKNKYLTKGAKRLIDMARNFTD
ncbi:MAG: LysR family transcriptional regulator [Sphaerochaetaceae bacterium]|nr:LysR family transcriptional regulator [Sphaerochaetaceae bacterium]